MTDADQGGEVVTGIIGEPFQLDNDGNPIVNAPWDGPIETPSASDVGDVIRGAFDELDAAGAGEQVPAEFLPGIAQEIGGVTDESQKDIWTET